MWLIFSFVSTFLCFHQSERLLSAMAKLDCNICLPDIDLYYDETSEIVEKNQRLLEIALRYPEGSKILNAGRVVVLRDGVTSRFFAESAKNS